MTDLDEQYTTTLAEAGRLIQVVRLKLVEYLDIEATYPRLGDIQHVNACLDELAAFLDASPPPDDLITITQAGAMLGVPFQTIQRAIDTGRLRPYYDLTAPNPRKGRRLVSRAEVERL